MKHVLVLLDDICIIARFLGRIGYYRRFVQSYGMLGKPLTYMEQIKWSTEAHNSFDRWKATTISAHVLAIPEFSKLFIIESDASRYGLGAVLMAVFMQDEYPIAYFSHGLTYKEQLKPIY